jgi:hypothetical protein
LAAWFATRGRSFSPRAHRAQTKARANIPQLNVTKCVTGIVGRGSDGARQWRQIGQSVRQGEIMKKKTQLKSIDPRALGHVRGGTFYPPPWIERFEPQPQPWITGTPISQVGVILQAP